MKKKMEVTDTKKIKVKITDNAGTYTTDGHKYLPGDIVQIDPSDFCDWFMEKVEPKPKKTAIVEEVVTEALAVVTPLEEVTEESKPKTRRRRS